MFEISSYSNIYTLGHKELEHLFDEDVIVEEKVDGSQFSFGLNSDGQLGVRSKGVVIDIDNPPKMFDKAIETVLNIKSRLQRGMIFRGEYLSKPKHNVLCYNRVPIGNIVVFDLYDEEEGVWQYVNTVDRFYWVDHLGLECVPVLFKGKITDLRTLEQLLETESFLGGVKVEGVVIKPAGYDLYGRDKKVIMGKLVRDEFKEQHAKEWKSSSPSGKDIVGALGEQYKVEARWQKAYQHLSELGVLINAPQDIPILMKEAQNDLCKEEKEVIMNRLFKWAWPVISRKAVNGLPEWYKAKLAEQQFTGVE